MLKKSFALLILALLALPLLAADGVRGNLVDVQWLQKNLNSPDLLLLDASGPDLYAKNHIAGAINVNIYELFAYGFGDAPVERTERLFQSIGISPGKKIVLYDNGGNNLATRLFFDLVYHGYPAESVFLLDGGLSKWQQSGFSVTAEPTSAPKPGTFKAARLKEDVRVGLEEVLRGSGDPDNTALVEALDAGWHYGELHPFDRAGHIPNGILAPGNDFYNADKTFKSPEEIRKMLAYLGVKPNQKIYTYCGGGVAASIPFFAARYIAGYPNVKLFPESELGWLSDPRELPYWTYDAPGMMRRAAWLQLWTGRMIRTFMGSTISIVDVRPAEQFNQGHAPFAVNIPGDVFRSNLGDLKKLAAILGAAGVNPAQEAVLISGAGLTKDSALAFAVLEKLGQKKVTLLIDSQDQWPQAGLMPTREATAVRPVKGRGDLAIPPTAYAANPRSGIVIADASSTTAAYPKVFIASGKEPPAKAFDGKVIHVPYTDLLNADGTPKAAKDIWTILNKAGVPRYAELVCFSDDPGEAASNYFVLKLMGFPDAKVLVSE